MGVKKEAHERQMPLPDPISRAVKPIPIENHRIFATAQEVLASLSPELTEDQLPEVSENAPWQVTINYGKIADEYDVSYRVIKFAEDVYGEDFPTFLYAYEQTGGSIYEAVQRMSMSDPV